MRRARGTRRRPRRVHGERRRHRSGGDVRRRVGADGHDGHAGRFERRVLFREGLHLFVAVSAGAAEQEDEHVRFAAQAFAGHRLAVFCQGRPCRRGPWRPLERAQRIERRALADIRCAGSGVRQSPVMPAASATGRSRWSAGSAGSAMRKASRTDSNCLEGFILLAGPPQQRAQSACGCSCLFDLPANALRSRWPFRCHRARDESAPAGVR